MNNLCRILLFGLGPIVAALGVGGLMMLPQPPSPITRENALRIQPRMTMEEVEAILGPAHHFEDHRGRPEIKVGDTVVCSEYRWLGPRSEVVVPTDRARRVITCTCRCRVDADESLLDRILDIIRDWCDP